MGWGPHPTLPPARAAQTPPVAGEQPGLAPSSAIWASSASLQVNLLPLLKAAPELRGAAERSSSSLVGQGRGMELSLLSPGTQTAGGTGQNWFQTHPESRVVRAEGTGRSGKADCPQLPRAGHWGSPRTSRGCCRSTGGEEHTGPWGCPGWDHAGLILYRLVSLRNFQALLLPLKFK